MLNTITKAPRSCDC